MAKRPTKVTQPHSQAETKPESPALRRYFPWLVAVLGFFVYANTLGHGFVLDDPLILAQNKYVTKGFGGMGDMLFKAYRADVADGAATGFLYRPLSPMCFAAEWALGGGKPFLFHLMQVLWYAATCALVYLTLRRLLRDQDWMVSAGAAILFAVHPLHTEVVANIKSRDEVMALGLGLLALYSWLRWRDQSDRKWLIISLIAFFLAMLSKESAITLLPAFAMADWFFRSGSRSQVVRGLGLSLIPVLCFLALRAWVRAGFVGAQQFDVMDNPIVGASGFAERSATGFMVLLKYLQLLIFPNPLICDYSFNQLPLVQWGNWQAITGLCVCAGMGIWALTQVRRRDALACFILLFLGSVVLYSQIPIVIGTLFGERLMFMPSFWFCGGLSLLLARVMKPQMGLYVLAAAGVLFAVLTMKRNPDWKDNLTLFSADVVKATRSVRLHNGVAGESYRAYTAAGRPAASVAALTLTMKTHAEAALAIKPNPVSFVNLGLAALENKQYAEAEQEFKKALELSPNFGVAKQNLIATYLNWGRIEAREKQNYNEAIRIFEALIQLGYSSPDVLQDLGTAYALNNDLPNAIKWFEKCLAAGSNDQTLKLNLARAYRSIGNIARAQELEK